MNFICSYFSHINLFLIYVFKNVTSKCISMFLFVCLGQACGGGEEEQGDEGGGGSVEEACLQEGGRVCDGGMYKVFICRKFTSSLEAVNMLVCFLHKTTHQYTLINTHINIHTFIRTSTHTHQYTLINIHTFIHTSTHTHSVHILSGFHRLHGGCVASAG